MINLKIVSLALIDEASFSNGSKIQLLRFVRGASDSQLKLFVVEGKVGNVTEEQERELDLILQEVAPIAAYYASGVVFSMATALAGKVFNRYFGEAAKQCAQKPTGKEKRLCKKRFMLRAYSEKIAVLRREASKCNQTAKPEKCQERFIRMIKNLDQQLIKLRTKD